MNIQAFLVISRSGTLRVVKNRPYLNNDEIAVALNINVPKVFFERLIPSVDINLPEEALIDVGAEIAVKQIAPDVAKSLGLEVETVEDGLKTMIEEKSKGGVDNG